jgi:threonyl-tRNA synthetase
LQFDFNLPERFDMTFTNDKGEDERPYMLHRALFGSFERFIGILIEHYAGAFPLWLAPEQVRIIPVADAFLPYAETVLQTLKNQQFRASIDTSTDSFSKKIRNAELWKVPYILIVGEKEEKADSLSVREFKTKEQYEMSVQEFVDKLTLIRKERKS